ncbi:DUF4337 domain-containing protein [Polynucleobacter sp. JS-Safj-400b-B2]|uniref:DUF4337 domain-containing protein n=1 Tax=Polynucleobacter sp. JS-Safj-400b-B2 TaxID=2576921 RepID=UPI001C0AD7B8|nr:DUF4337 domain-containing protein [Polynucleobacter sp. JS-Safj-400b-B2]MBU3626031.1 DUF4337 domain-containing protein [Polynucleobacter sp. JS-Safj-400b-B2]
MEAHESHELIEQSEEHRHDSKKWTALIISIMAMILAVNNVGGGNASKEATRHNIEASNFYAFYQAKSIKQHLLKLAVDRMDDESHNFPIKLNPGGPYSAIAMQALADRKGQYVNDIARYESDEKSGEGKKQLLEKAKEHEAERDHALKQDPWFDYAEGILQIGIVLLSISILASMPILTVAGGILGLIGTACMLNGFFLFA